MAFPFYPFSTQSKSPGNEVECCPPFESNHGWSHCFVSVRRNTKMTSLLNHWARDLSHSLNSDILHRQSRVFTQKFALIYSLYFYLGVFEMMNKNIFSFMMNVLGAVHDASEIAKPVRRFSNVFHLKIYAGGNLKTHQSPRSFWICAKIKLRQGHRMLSVTPSFPKSSVSKMFYVHTQTKRWRLSV